MHSFTMAPVAWVRAAAFPIALVEAFGDPKLGELAVSSDQADRVRFSDAYAHALARERTALWEATAGSSRFAKALALTNPNVARRLASFRTKIGDAKGARRLRITLYRYLARAVGRTEPCGLWAGVAFARWGEQTRIVPVPEKLAVAPNLLPFRYIVRRLAQLPRYRAKCRYRANPTLARQVDGNWIFWTWGASGALQPRRLSTRPPINRILQQLLPLPALPLSEITATLATFGDVKVADVLETLISNGILVGGLDLPTSFLTVWHALDNVEKELDDNDRFIWQSHVMLLRRMCGELEQALEKMPVHAVQRIIADVTACIGALAREFTVDLPKGALRVPLYCDLRLPFDVELAPHARSLFEETITGFEHFMESENPSVLYSESQRLQFGRQIAGGVSLAEAAFLVSSSDRRQPATWQALVSTVSPRTELATRIARWEKLLSTGADEVFCRGTSSPDLPVSGRTRQNPFGCLLVSLEQKLSGARLRVRGWLSDPTPYYSRFAGLLSPDNLGRDDPMLSWMRAAIRDLAHNRHIEIAELKTLADGNPNACAGADFTPHAIELWTATPGRLGLTGAVLGLEGDVPVLRVPCRPKPLLVMASTAADIAIRDPVAQSLLFTSFRDRAMLPFQPSLLSFEGEFTRPHWSPKVSLPNGAIVRPRRTVLSSAMLTCLLGERSVARRFVLWQALARQYDWPPLLTVRRDLKTPLLVHRDSPLALEAAFAGARNQTDFIVVEEFEPGAWLEGPEGKRFVAEIAVPYQRHQHFLSNGFSERVESDLAL